MFVTHGADLHALLPLTVTLGEELHHDAVGPLPVDLQWLGGVAQVGAVHHVLQDLWAGDRSTEANYSASIKGLVRQRECGIQLLHSYQQGSKCAC